MSEAANQPVGQVVDGRYRIVRKIAEGGMASVYEATDERLDRQVAIKVMHTQLAQGPRRAQFQERFRREARSAAAVANPHIVQVYDTGEFNGLDYLVMEYVHGVNLRHDMNAEGTFDVRETLRIIGEILDGLAAAHRIGVVHRDIKPENILINDRGHVQITDFGLAKAASQATLSTTGMLLGTAAYLAPEMIERNEATMQGDLYAVGIVAWEMLTGAVPFLADNPVTVVFKHVHEDVPPLASACPGVAPAISDFVATLCARAVESRPANAMVAARLLSALASSLSADQLGFRAPLPSGFVPDVPAAPRPITASHARPDTTMAYDGTMPLPKPADRATQPLGDAVSRQPPHRDRPQTFERFFTDADANAADHDGSASPSAHASGKGSAAGAGRFRTIGIGIAVIVTLALFSGGGFGWWYYFGPGSYWTLPGAADVKCAETSCTVQGASASSYTTSLSVAGIPYTQSEDYSDTVAAGAIISTDPANVGDRISKRSGQKVSIVVSKGVRQATIPDDIKDAGSANGKDPVAALKTAGFDNVTHNEAGDDYSMDVPAGSLLTINVNPGGTYDHNAAITVTLSKGRKPVTMPNVVGRSKDDALAALQDLKLTVNVSESFDDSVEAGTVISASQQEGTRLAWGDTVDMVISKGPQMATIPSVVGKQYDEAEKILKDLGFDVKKSAPLGDWTHVVRMQNPDAGQTVRVRDSNGTPTVITLTVA